MGILNSGDYQYQGETNVKTGSLSECKPDYEGMVKRSNERIIKAAAFKRAIFDFLEDRRIPDALVVIVGELDFEIYGQQKTIERLIKHQEKEK